MEDVAVTQKDNNIVKISIKRRQDNLSEFGNASVEDNIKGWIAGEERKFPIFPCNLLVTLADFDGIRLNHFDPATTLFYVEDGVLTIIVSENSPIEFPKHILERAKFANPEFMQAKTQKLIELDLDN
jgi:hypothetical protein